MTNDVTTPTAAVEVEQARLEGLVALVFEDRHYSRICNCESCKETRKHLSENDLAFIDKVDKHVRSSNPKSPFAL